MDAYKAGDRVVRVIGGPGTVGDNGTVVEATDRRVRVKWDRTRKRTWVAVHTVRPVLPKTTKEE